MQYEYYLTPSHRALAQSNGISDSALEARVYRYGWDIERATTEPIKKRDPERIKWRNIAVKNGLTRGQFNERVYKQKWPYERAATQPIYSQEEKVTIMNEARSLLLTPEQSAIAKGNGLNSRTVRARIKVYKWPVDKAINTPVKKQFRKKSYVDRQSGGELQCLNHV